MQADADWAVDRTRVNFENHMGKNTGFFNRRWMIVCLAILPVMPTLAANVPHADLQHAMAQLAARVQPGVLGITVVDMDTHARVQINADRAYPMMSVFKVSVAAAVLTVSKADKRRETRCSPRSAKT